MATTAAPHGARPVSTTSASGSFNGKVQHLSIASEYGTSIFNGDFVKMVAGGTIEKDTGTATLTTVGIFMGCKYTDPTTKQMTFSQYWPASTVATDAMAYVLSDPDVVFLMQADGAIAQTALGSNFDVIQTAGTTSIGNSKTAVDADSTATTNTCHCESMIFMMAQAALLVMHSRTHSSFLMLVMRTETQPAFKEN